MTTNRKGMVAVFLAVLAVVAFSTPAQAMLYSWVGSPNISDGIDAGNGAKDITGIWHAFDGTDHFFRMDVVGPISSTDFANVYGIYIDTNSANLTPGNLPSASNSAVTVVFNWGTSMYEQATGTGPNITGWSYLRTDSILEWKVTFTEGYNNFYYTGATSTLNGSNTTIVDTTDVAATPIPNAAWLLGSGVLALIGLKRRQSRKT